MNDHRPVATVNHAHLEQIPSAVRTNEHGEAVVEALNSNRIANGVNHALFGDPMPLSAGSNYRKHSVAS